MTPREKIRNEVMEKVFRDFERQGMTWDHYTCIDVAIEKTAEAISDELYRLKPEWDSINWDDVIEVISEYEKGDTHEHERKDALTDEFGQDKMKVIHDQAYDLGHDRGLDEGYEKGRKDMAKELRKELKKKITVTKHLMDRNIKYNNSSFRDAYEGMIDGLEWALKHLGEDEDE